MNDLGKMLSLIHIYTRELTAETEKQEFFDYLESISSGITVDEEGAILPQNKWTIKAPIQEAAR